MTKIELGKKTKTDLVKLAKRKFGLTLKPALVKEEMISLIQNAAHAKKKLSASKVAAKKPAMKAAPPAKKKSARPAAAKRKKPAEPIKIDKVTEVRQEIPATAARARVHTGEEAVIESKYYVAPVQEHIHPTYEPPERYNDDRIVLLVRDPFCIFSYWDLHGDTPKRVSQKHRVDAGSCEIVLRVYDVTGKEFNGRNGNSYFDISVGTTAGNWYIKVPHDDRFYCVEIGLRDSEGNFYPMARSNIIPVPREGVSDRLDEEWMVAEEDFWKMYGLSGGFGALGSSEEVMEAMRKRLEGEVASGAVSSFGASEMMVRGKQEDFWFHLNCELIIYGATEPDAEVTLGGNRVKLRPDGTFTTRFALPDGLRVIPAKAVSADKKHEKSITPTLSRTTTSFEDINRQTEQL